MKCSHHWLRVTVVATLMMIGTGCGASMSTYLILKAQYELDGAEAAEAEKFAPYEYTAANLYLDKAREEQGYADFGASIKYAWKAEELAIQGRERSNEVKARETAPLEAPSFVPGDISPPQAPTSPVIIEETPSAPATNIQITPPQSSPAPSTPVPEIQEIEIVPPPEEESNQQNEAAPPLQFEIVPIDPESTNDSSSSTTP